MEKNKLLGYILQYNMQLMNLEDRKYDLETIILSQLEEKKNELESVLLSFNYSNTKIVGDIIKRDSPSKPKKKLTVVFSFVVGFILSVFLVLCLDFIKNLRNNFNNIEKSKK